ncbi:ea9d4429-be80-42fa-b8a3-4fc0ed5ed736 [Sclerotinia trifoliorum]|uniref:Ea9d4429-be80-42fa-b8a3-4fc0ed5ed736 n=1 Tax=Sclerotinia trifoliorum TaxID=28548 RepID=A0A8H2ZR10_9HELO|nr:ea9d4429-be80-42fa-b8a3-4fc0ed5ed736 [Sclerotinia trifoliorum]
MKTIPSLVASSTVGVAAAGLALGRPDHSTPPSRTSSKKRKPRDIVTDVDDSSNLGTPSTVSRPPTSSTMATPESRNAPDATGLSSTPTSQTLTTFLRRPSNARLDSPTTSQNGAARRWSLLRSGDGHNEVSGEEVVRDSASSRGSWIRKLSLPISGNSSPRSSIAPESPSLTFSNGSAAPILSPPRDSPTQQPPNKLVKRQTSERNRSGTVSSGSKSQVPTLRRPATSHQRSVTLQQRFIEDAPGTNTQARPTALRRSTVSTQGTPLRKFTESPRSSWRMYFKSRPTKFSFERSTGGSGDGNVHNFLWTSKRVMPDHTVRPTLVKPHLITVSTEEMEGYYDEEGVPCDEPIDQSTMEEPPSSPLEDEDDLEDRKPLRRSLSMHFSSPTWISRTGSLKNKKRSTENTQAGRRHVSAPLPLNTGRLSVSANGPTPYHCRLAMDQMVFQREPRSPIEDFSPVSPMDPFTHFNYAPRRNTSSPLPPLNRLSTFNLDLARLGMPSSSSSAPLRSPSSPLPMSKAAATSFSSAVPGSTNCSSPYYGTLSSKHGMSELGDRASTLIGSDNEMRGFASGEDEDMDFQSETVYDSLRSGATSSLRSQNTPLDSMFDESPPTNASVNCHAKTKRLSIHDLMANGVFGEAEHRIIEEDENQATPVKVTKISVEVAMNKSARFVDADETIPASPPSFSIASKELATLTLDNDDEDEDWTRDEDNENMEARNQLSPPNGLAVRRVSPIARGALVEATYSGSTNGNHYAERPKSNLFDWSEPSTSEKDLLGSSSRPRTAHVKHLALNGRGGRTVGRKGPTPLHIRSQSVPVVPDLNNQRDHTKLTPKFGTWGLGAKGVSEDWDNDFEFESNDEGGLEDGNDNIENSVMFVPPAIQASQANVVGHVGQIREVCLLVEDLKRLRLLARDKDLINGPSAQLWKEAEGIIALAVPDEEDPTLSPPHSPISISVSHDFNDKFIDRGTGSDDVAIPDVPVEVLNRFGKPSGHIYDGSTVRRRSVFSPDDDIFGAGSVIHNPPTRDGLRPPLAPIRSSSAKTAAEVARTVMETMHQHRSTSDPLLSDMAEQSSNKMPFDTTSLRDLVHRASVLSRKLADIIRETDGTIQSPVSTPHRESSPAFTRVFTDPMSSPPKHLPRSHSNNSMLSGSIDSSPTRSLGQRMHMMTVV